jgi:glycosyltransferase involved in cell wall biosynthesis
MNLFLDGMFYKCSGVGRVFENLMDALVSRGGFERIYTVVPASRKEEFLDRFRHPSVRAAFVPYGPMTAGDLFRKPAVLKAVSRDVSLYFFPSHNVPWTVPGRYVVTVNDVTVFSEHSEQGWHERLGFRLVLSRGMRRAEKIVAISGATKSALEDRFRVVPGKVEVLYPWIEDRFFPASGDGGTSFTPQGEGDYLLYLGLRIAHKNLEGLIRAFLLVAEAFPGLRLVIAGSRYREGDAVDRWNKDPRLADRLVEIFNPSDEEILRLFAGAKAFVFPSFAEGFGLPPLEAMASGVPVVCSDIPVFREVYGDAVHFVDPHRPESIAEGIRRVLTDHLYATGLARKGRERSGLYRKERSMNSYLDLIRKLGADRP